MKNKVNSLSRVASENLKVILQEKSITQEEAAVMLNVDERTLRRWLKNGITKLSSIEMICKVFNIEAKTILSKRG